MITLRKTLLWLTVGSLTFLQSDTPLQTIPNGENGSQAILIINVRSNTGQPLEANTTTIKAPNTYQQVSYGGTATVVCNETGSHQVSVSLLGYTSYQQTVEVTDTTIIAAVLSPI